MTTSITTLALNLLVSERIGQRYIFADKIIQLIHDTKDGNKKDFLNVNPEDALERTNKKFIKRFQYLESKASELNKPLMDMSLAEMDVFWNEAKKL